jgi:hypothetical protein
MTIDKLKNICIALKKMNISEHILFMTLEEYAEMDESLNKKSHFNIMKEAVNMDNENHKQYEGFLFSAILFGVTLHFFDLDKSVRK